MMNGYKIIHRYRIALLLSTVKDIVLHLVLASYETYYVSHISSECESYLDPNVSHICIRM